MNDASGNVGIGNTASNVNDQVGSVRPLLVSGSDSATTIAGSVAAVVIGNSNTTTSNTSQLGFAAITGANTTYFTSAAINCIFGARTNGQYPTGQLVFSTSTSLNSAPTEKIRIGSSGQLGIGGANYGTSGQVLTSGGSGAAPSWTTVGGFSNFSVGTYTAATNTSGTPLVWNSNGSLTFTVPTGITKVKVTVIGGGGGGGSAGSSNYGSGGGGGGAAIEIISGLTPGDTVSVTVGAGGAAGSAGNTSSFGAYCSATGGSGGAQNTAGGAGGVGSGGDLNIAGGGGATYAFGGAGGSSIYGGGGRGGVTSTGGVGGAYGGGGGGVSGAGTGGAGAAGVVIVEY